MDFQDAINNILKPTTFNGIYYKPAITTSDGKKQDFHASRPGRRHEAVDINYHFVSGATLGHNEINRTHPEVGSPVSGKVKYIDRERYGKIQITDEQGFVHEILHLDWIDQTLEEGASYVKAGQIIGRMGGRGPGNANKYVPHVHYAVKFGNDIPLDPVTFWNGHHGRAYAYDRPAGMRSGGSLTRDRQDYRVVHRIEEDGSLRGYFISE